MQQQKTSEDGLRADLKNAVRTNEIGEKLMELCLERKIERFESLLKKNPHLVDYQCRDEKMSFLMVSSLNGDNRLITYLLLVTRPPADPET